MGFRRAEWHSGLTYQQTCEECKTVVKYKDDSLDFRPWFADGFIYCPTCKKPLRHKEEYAIDKKEDVVVVKDLTTPEVEKYCSQCGHKVKSTDNFCSNCGNSLK